MSYCWFSLSPLCYFSHSDQISHRNNARKGNLFRTEKKKKRLSSALQGSGRQGAFQGQGGSSFSKGCLPHAHIQKLMGMGACGDRKRVLETRRGSWGQDTALQAVACFQLCPTSLVSRTQYSISSWGPVVWYTHPSGTSHSQLITPFILYSFHGSHCAQPTCKWYDALVSGFEMLIVC